MKRRPRATSGLTHVDETGRLRMVDVSDKDITRRIAVARGAINMRPETLALILEEKIEKGDVFSVARVAGIMAAKKTSELIPMCHPLSITSVEINLHPQENPARVEIEAAVRVDGKTGFRKCRGLRRCRLRGSSAAAPGELPRRPRSAGCWLGRGDPRFRASRYADLWTADHGRRAAAGDP